MVEYSPTITIPTGRNATIHGTMKVSILIHVLFAGLALSATSPLSNINPSNPCTPKDTSYGITLWTQSDADAVSSCSSIFSDLYIDFTFPGKIRLDGVQAVNGSLGVGIYSPNRTYYDGSNYVTNSSGTSTLTEVSFYNLSTVGGYLAFGSIPTLLNVSVPYLNNINSSFLVLDVPSLELFDCGSALTNVGYNILINGTAIQTLTIGASYSGVNFDSDVTIVNSTKLNQLQLSAYNISGTVYIEASCDISFPSLGGITGNLTIVNANSISIDSLNWVGQSIWIHDCNYLTNFSAPLLVDFGGDLVATDNSALNNISIPTLLQMPGGIQILNNSALQNVSGFPQLREIGQNVDIEGPVDEVSFPQLRTFYGANFTVSSSHSDLNCTDLDAYAHSNPAIIRGAYTCNKNASSTTATPSSGTSPDTSPTSISTESGGLSTGAKAGIAIGVIIAAALLFGLIWFVVWKQKKVDRGVYAVPPEYIPELPQGGYYGKPDPSATASPIEVDSERPPKEISSDEDPRELESRPVDDTRHNHHSDVYEGPTPVDDTRVSRLTGYEGPTPVEKRQSHGVDVYEMPS